MARGYGQYCPVALATELLGERWTLLVVTALVDGATRFNDLQRALPRISATVLSQRLRSLEDAGVVARTTGPRGPAYSLTEAGRELEPTIMSLATWGQRWARDLEPDDLDPRFLAWSMHLRTDPRLLPTGRTVVEFEFPDGPAWCRRFWIVSTDGAVDVCIRRPGHPVDLHVTSELRRFVDAWRGFRSLRAEVEAGRIRLDGRPDLVRAFPDWLRLSSAAHVARRRPGREHKISNTTARQRARRAGSR